MTAAASRLTGPPICARSIASIQATAREVAGSRVGKGAPVVRLTASKVSRAMPTRAGFPHRDRVGKTARTCGGRGDACDAILPTLLWPRISPVELAEAHHARRDQTLESAILDSLRCRPARPIDGRGRHSPPPRALHAQRARS